MLLKADRAGMLESVESRSPFLDLSFFSLNNLIDNYEPKRLLKMELKGLLSDYPLEAKKEGFFSPYKLLLTTNSIKKLINSNIFSKVDEIIGLPKFSNRFKNELKYLTNKAFELDVFGAPTFIVNNKLFWGQDRLEYALEELNS